MRMCSPFPRAVVLSKEILQSSITSSICPSFFPLQSICPSPLLSFDIYDRTVCSSLYLCLFLQPHPHRSVWFGSLPLWLSLLLLLFFLLILHRLTKYPLKSPHFPTKASANDQLKMSNLTLD